MKKEMTYFKIKVGNPDGLKKAKKIIFVGFGKDGSSVYRTISFDGRDEVFAYLKESGCNPESVSKLSLSDKS